MAQLHATYIFKSSIWIAASIGINGAGETVLNGVEKDDNQQSSRYGVDFSYLISILQN